MRLLHLILLAALLAQPAHAADRKATLSVGNMTCALCPLTVKSAILRVKGVISVEVDQGLAQASVRYDDTRATTDAITSASTNAGYPATVVQAQ